MGIQGAQSRARMEHSGLPVCGPSDSRGPAVGRRAPHAAARVGPACPPHSAGGTGAAAARVTKRTVRDLKKHAIMRPRSSLCGCALSASENIAVHSSSMETTRRRTCGRVGVGRERMGRVRERERGERGEKEKRSAQRQQHRGNHGEREEVSRGGATSGHPRR